MVRDKQPSLFVKNVSDEKIKTSKKENKLKGMPQACNIKLACFAGYEKNRQRQKCADLKLKIPVCLRILDWVC